MTDEEWINKTLDDMESLKKYQTAAGLSLRLDIANAIANLMKAKALISISKSLSKKE